MEVKRIDDRSQKQMTVSEVSFVHAKFIRSSKVSAASPEGHCVDLISFRMIEEFDEPSNNKGKLQTSCEFENASQTFTVSEMRRMRLMSAHRSQNPSKYENFEEFPATRIYKSGP